MKIGFISKQDPLSFKTWSGTIRGMYSVISSRHNIKLLQEDVNILSYRIRSKLFKALLNRNFDYEHDLSLSKKYGESLTKILKNTNVDLLFAPAGSSDIAFLDTDLPVIYLSDAIFPAVINYYHLYSRLNKKNYNDGFEIEKRALTKAKRVIFSSEWAKQSVKEYYDIPEDKIDAFPFGANLLRIPEEKELKFIKSGEINLLFIGLDWERKGGTIALDTHRILKKNGIKSKLFIVGCSPKLAELDESVIIYPYLNKNDNRDFEKLFNIFRNSDFLILPTRAECSAIVLCEASAFGVPSITTDTGGLASHVENGVNGYRLSLEAKAEEYAEKILNIYEDTGTYINMRHTSRQKFENELNWDSWMKNFEMTIKKALE